MSSLAAERPRPVAAGAGAREGARNLKQPDRSASGSSDPGGLIAVMQKNALEEIRVTLERYQGKRLCDIRVYTEYRTTGETGPTKKGVTVRIEQLPELIAALQRALIVSNAEEN